MLVYNAFGQLVKTVRDANEISVVGLPKGVYLLRVIIGNDVRMQKIVIE